MTTGLMPTIAAERRAFSEVLDGLGLEGGSSARCDQGGGGNQEGVSFVVGGDALRSSAASPRFIPRPRVRSNVCGSGHSLANRDVATSR